MTNKVYVVTIFYDNEDEYTGSKVEAVFSTAEKAKEYVKNWQVPIPNTTEELLDFVNETDIRVIRVKTNENVYTGVYYFSIKEMEVE